MVIKRIFDKIPSYSIHLDSMKLSSTKILIIPLFLSLFLSSCSSQKQEQSSSETLSDNSGDFGSLEFNQSKTKIFNFKNETPSAVSVSPEIQGAQGASFRILSAKGCSSIAPGSYCYVQVSVAAQGLVAGIHQASLIVSPMPSINLSVEIKATPNPVVETQVDGVVTDSLTLSAAGKSKVSKIIALRNIGPISSSTSPVIKTSNDLIVLSNSCGISLLPSKLCFVRVGFQGKNIEEQIQGSITIGENIVNINVESSVIVGTPNLVSSDSEIELGDFQSSGEKEIQILSFSNTGSAPANLNLDSLPPGFSVLASTCGIVAPKGTCHIRLQYISDTSSGLGSYSQNVSLGSSSVTFNHAVVSSLPLSNIKISGLDDVLKDSCSLYSATIEDSSEEEYVTSHSLSFNISGLSGYADSSCSQSLSSLVFAPFESQKNFYVSSSSSGSSSLSLIGEVSGSKNIFVYNSLSLSPGSISITTANSQQFSPVGGKGPFVFSKVSGVGSISSTGSFSSNEAGSAQVRVVDSLGNVATSSVTINSNLVLALGTCSSSTLETSSCQLDVSGGVGTLSLSTDKGSVSSTGVFQGSCLQSPTGSSLVQVVDSYGNAKTLSVSYTCVFSGCSEILAKGVSSSGNFWVDTDGKNQGTILPEQLYCEFDANGAWTLNTRLNTNDATTQEYQATSFWEGTGTGTLSGNLDYMAKYFANNAGFREIKLKYIYGVSTSDTTIEAIFRKDDNSLSLKQSLALSPSNSNPTWARTSISGTDASGFFGSSLIFKTIGNGVVGNISAGGADLSRIWYNLQAVGECNQGGSIGHIGDYNSNNWIWEVGRGYSAAASTCPQNGYRMGVGTNYNQKTFGTTPITPTSLYTNGFMNVFTKDIYFHHAKNCLDAKTRSIVNQSGNMNSGLWTIDPDGYSYGEAPFTVYCDQVIDGGGWTLVMEGSGNFSGNELTSATSAKYNACLLDDAKNCPANSAYWQSKNIKASSYLKKFGTAAPLVVKLNQEIAWGLMPGIRTSDSRVSYTYYTDNPGTHFAGYASDSSGEAGCQDTASGVYVYLFALSDGNTPCGGVHSLLYTDSYGFLSVSGGQVPGQIFVK